MTQGDLANASTTSATRVSGLRHLDTRLDDIVAQGAGIQENRHRARDEALI